MGIDRSTKLNKCPITIESRLRMPVTTQGGSGRQPITGS